MSKYDKWYIIRKLLCSTLIFCKKKFENLQKLNLSQNPDIQLKCLPKKICPKNEKLYIFETPLTMLFQICKIFCKISNNLIFNQEKLKMCKFPLTGCLQKICNFFRKTCAICFLMSKAFQKAKFYQNLTSGSGSKQRFSLLQEKAAIQAVCLRTQTVSIKARFQA